MTAGSFSGKRKQTNIRSLRMILNGGSNCTRPISVSVPFDTYWMRPTVLRTKATCTLARRKSQLHFQFVCAKLLRSRSLAGFIRVFFIGDTHLMRASFDHWNFDLYIDISMLGFKIPFIKQTLLMQWKYPSCVLFITLCRLLDNDLAFLNGWKIDNRSCW